MHALSTICALKLFSLVTVVTSESGISCDIDDTSCNADPSSGSMLLQVDRSHRKEAATEAHILNSASARFSRLAHRAAPNGFCKDHPCRATLLAVPAPTSQLQQKQRGSVGKTEALSQAGYAKVASLKDDTEMKEFIRRVIEKYDCKVSNEGGLSGIVPWFSGTTMVQSLPQLEDTLLFAVLSTPSWLSYKNSAHITGDKAELGFVGYVQVAAMKNDAEMKKFVRRVCTDMGVKIINEGGFSGMVKFYSGSDNFQSYDKLRSEIRSAANAPHTWAEWSKTPQKAAVATPITSSKSKGFSLLAVRASEGFCKSHPCRMQLLELESTPSVLSHSKIEPPSQLTSKSATQTGSSSSMGTSTRTSTSSGLGKRASLDQAGYAQVAAVKDDQEMKEFVQRVIEKYDCRVENMGGMMGIVPWFSGTTSTQNIQALEDTLLFAVLTRSKPWLSYKNSDHVTGDTAKLGFVGYVQVAAMRNDYEMKKFVRRVCHDMGVKVVDEGGFEGMVKFYSGTDNFQSYDKLQDEIKSAANAPHSWADWEAGKPPQPDKKSKK